jgi:hypothetical protein
VKSDAGLGEKILEIKFNCLHFAFGFDDETAAIDSFSDFFQQGSEIRVLKGALQRAALFFSIRRVRNEALSGISRQ